MQSRASSIDFTQIVLVPPPWQVQRHAQERRV